MVTEALWMIRNLEQPMKSLSGNNEECLWMIWNLLPTAQSDVFLPLKLLLISTLFELKSSLSFTQVVIIESITRGINHKP